MKKQRKAKAPRRWKQRSVLEPLLRHDLSHVVTEEDRVKLTEQLLALVGMILDSVKPGTTLKNVLKQLLIKALKHGVPLRDLKTPTQIRKLIDSADRANKRQQQRARKALREMTQIGQASGQYLVPSPQASNLAALAAVSMEEDHDHLD